MKSMKIARMLVAISALSLVSESALAQTSDANTPATCPAMPGASSELAAQDSSARLKFIRASMERDAGRAVTWRWTWILIPTAASAALFTAAALQRDRGMRIDFLFAGGGAALGAIAAIAGPLSVTEDHETLEQHLKKAGGKNTCSVLAGAEKLFIHAAEDEAEGQSFKAHAFPIAGTVAASLVMGFAFDRWVPGAIINTVVNVGMAELRIATQPTGVYRDLAAYRAGRFAPASPTPVSFTILPWADARAAGVAAAVSW